MIVKHDDVEQNTPFQSDTNLDTNSKQTTSKSHYTSLISTHTLLPVDENAKADLGTEQVEEIVISTAFNSISDAHDEIKTVEVSSNESNFLEMPKATSSKSVRLPSLSQRKRGLSTVGTKLVANQFSNEQPQLTTGKPILKEKQASMNVTTIEQEQKEVVIVKHNDVDHNTPFQSDINLDTNSKQTPSKLPYTCKSNTNTLLSIDENCTYESDTNENGTADLKNEQAHKISTNTTNSVELQGSGGVIMELVSSKKIVDRSDNKNPIESNAIGKSTTSKTSKTSTAGTGHLTSPPERKRALSVANNKSNTNVKQFTNKSNPK